MIINNCLTHRLSKQLTPNVVIIKKLLFAPYITVPTSAGVRTMPYGGIPITSDSILRMCFYSFIYLFKMKIKREKV